MSIINKIAQKLIYPKLDPARYEKTTSKQGGGLTERELRYQTLQKIVKTIASDLNFEKISQRVVDVMVEDMDYPGGILFLIDKQKRIIYPWTTSNTPLIKMILTWLPKSLREYSISFDKKQNKIVEVYHTRKLTETNDLSDFISPPINQTLASRIKQVVGIKSTFALPVIFKGKLVGILMFNSLREKTKELEREMVSLFADIIGIFIQNAKLYSRTRDQVHQLKTIFDITNAVVSTLDPQKVAQRAVDMIASKQEYIGALLAFIDEKKDHLKISAITETQLAKSALKLLSKDVKDYIVPLNDPKYQHILGVRAIKENTFISSDNFRDAFSPPLPPKIADSIKKVLNAKCITALPIKRRGKIIGTIAFIIKNHSSASLTDAHKNFMQTFAFVIGIAVDNAMSFQAKESALSELAKTSKELERKNMALELSSQRERDLLDVLGHELRTPLSIVKNALELMALKKKKGILKDEDIDKNIDAARESLDREIRIIETILGATKLESKMLELHLEEVDIIDVVNDGIAAQKGTASKKGIEIDFKSPEPSFPSVYADRTKIQEVFDNLLSNSIKYTQKGEITIMLKESEDFISLSVKDTGVGIPKKEIEKLGIKFYRVQQYLEKEGKMRMVRPGGSGLGLYVTFGYVKAMGGKMTVESKVGKGSTFTFTIPKYTGQKPSGYRRQEKDVFKRLGLEKA